MSDNSKKVSQLPIVTSATTTDRIVLLSNASGNAVLSSINLANLPAALPSNGGAFGYVLTSDASGNASWAAFSGIYNSTTVNTPSYNASNTDTVIFADPYSIGNDITVILPIDTAIEGKEVFVKNISINPGWNVYVTTINGINMGSALIEDPVIHTFTVGYSMGEAGEGETWIHNGNYWRHTSTQRSAPIFYTTSNTYHQVIIQNANTGQDASGDFVVYNDQGNYINGTGPYVDMGVDSSTYSNTLYSLFHQNDAYVYAGGANNFILGTDSDNSIIFFANGTLTNNRLVTVNTQGVTTNVNIVPQTNYITLGNTTNYWNTVYTNSIAVPNGSLITSTLLVSPVINNANLDHIVAYSTTSASIPIGTYGNANEIPAPWSVYQLTAVPSPVLQVNDLVAGTGVPLNNHIAFIGTGTYANLIIANTTFTVAPPANGTFLTITRDVINPSFSITTVANTNIALIPGSNGVIIVNSDIVPVTTNNNRLGTPAKRFKELWLGPGTLYVADETLGVDQGLGAKDGNFYIKGGAGFQVGEFTLRDNQIAITDPTRDILFGNTLATGNVVFNRPIAVKTIDTGKTSFSVSTAGLVNIITPTTILTTQSALSITGANSEVSQPRNFTGTLLQGTAQDGQPARVGFDAFGANTYVAIAGRGARGTVQAPSGTQANDTIMRLSMQGWTTDGNTYAGSIGRINMQAAENFYTANTGTKITFQLTPAGSSTIQNETVAFTSNGINFTNNPSGVIEFNDGSVQNTAFNATNAVTRINVGTGLTQSANFGIVGIDSNAVLSVAGTANQVSVANVGGNYTLSLPQNIGTNSVVQFNTLTVTNLNVTGATTTANNLSIANAVIHLAANSTSSAQLDQGGITLGNTAAAYEVSILYNLSNNAWTTGNTNLITKNLTATANVSANVGWFIGQVHAGAAYIGYDYPNASMQVDSNINSYNQVVQQNHNGGTQGSTDFVAVNDIGNDGANYIDLGINSSTYANNYYSMGGPSDGYLYVNSGNLQIATQTAGKIIQFYTGNTTSDALRVTINTTGLSVVGNVSATYFTGTLLGTANNVTYVGTVSAANVVSNAQLSANLAGYQTTDGLSANVVTLTSNLANYIVANTGLISNSSGVFVNSAYIVSVASGADNDSAYQTAAGLASNVVTLTSNNTSFVGSVTAANVVSNAQLTANLANYALASALSSYQTTAGLASNVATLTSNNVSFVGTVSAANVVSNAQLSSNLSAYVLSSALSSQLAGYQTAAGLASNVATLTSNNVTFVGTVTAANVVSNAQLSANLANYQTSAGLASNVATLTSNNVSFVGTVAAANVVSNTQLASNLANYVTNTQFTSNLANYTNTAGLSSYQTTAGLSANVLTLTSNNTSFVGSVSAANVVSNTQLLSNLANYQTTAGLNANVSALGYMNTAAAYTISGVRSHSANLVINTTAGIIANGSVGTAGQFLTSNGSSVYWSNSYPQEQVFSLEADRTLLTANASQSMFGVGVTLASNTKYRYMIYGTVFKANTSGPSSGALQFGITNTTATAVLGRHYFVTNPRAANTTQTTVSPAYQMSQNITTGFSSVVTISPANTGATWYDMVIDGTLDVTTGGTINPQIAFTHTANVGAGTILQAGATMEIWPIGNTTSNSVIGTWA